MNGLVRALLPVLLSALAGAAVAEDQALRPELFVSSDSDGNDSQRLSLGWDWRHEDIENWQGMRLERARFSGDGWSETSERLYVRAAGVSGKWRWRGEAGTDGDDLLGSASVHSEEPWRKEMFLERDVLETREGLALGRVHTFVGAALDVPISERWTATGLAGLQDFGGDNLRRHLRANLVYAVLPEQGLSLQLRLRQFNDSDPRELDYFAPGRYREALAVVSMRRFVGGYQWRATAGLGRKDFTGAASQPARMLELDFQTPKDRGRYLRATAGYSDAPSNNAVGDDGYRYRYLRVEGIVEF
jgi:hypothetical protein